MSVTTGEIVLAPCLLCWLTKRSFNWKLNSYGTHL